MIITDKNFVADKGSNFIVSKEQNVKLKKKSIAIA